MISLHLKKPVLKKLLDINLGITYLRKDNNLLKKYLRKLGTLRAKLSALVSVHLLAIQSLVGILVVEHSALFLRVLQSL